MSTVGQASGDPNQAQAARDRKSRARLIAAVVLAAVVTLFAVLNSQTVSVHFILTTARLPMIVVIAACALIGVAVGWVIGRRRATRVTKP
jgi:uncharacterized integral membrane protein